MRVTRGALGAVEVPNEVVTDIVELRRRNLYVHEISHELVGRYGDQVPTFPTIVGVLVAHNLAVMPERGEVTE